MANVAYEKQIEAFKEASEALGLGEDLLYQSTLERYINQIEMLESMREQVEEGPAIIEREYIKGKPSPYANPIISEYNKAVSAANQTCSLLSRLKARAEKDADPYSEEDYEL